MEGEIKNFSDKQKLKECSNTKPILKKYIERSSLNLKKKYESHNRKSNYIKE